MEDKKLRKRMDKIRGAMTIITNEINAIYNDNAETKQPKKKDKLFQQGHNETDKQFADRVFTEENIEKAREKEKGSGSFAESAVKGGRKP